MERRRISRASSASVLVSDRRRRFNVGVNQVIGKRPTSANSYKSYNHRNDLPTSEQLSSLKSSFQKWTLANLDLSPNIRRAIAIATKKAYKNIRKEFYGDPSSENDDTIKKEIRADLMLDRFLEKIHRAKTGEFFRGPGAERRHWPGIAVINSNTDQNDDIEGHHDLPLDTLIDKVKRTKASGSCRDEKPCRPGSATVSKGGSAKERQNKTLNAKRRGGVIRYDIADSILERRERIRNRSMNIEQHVIEARERIRRAKILRHAEIQAITAALESNQIDQDRIREDAIHAAKQRVWRRRLESDRSRANQERRSGCIFDRKMCQGRVIAKTFIPDAPLSVIGPCKGPLQAATRLNPCRRADRSAVMWMPEDGAPALLESDQDMLAAGGLRGERLMA